MVEQGFGSTRRMGQVSDEEGHLSYGSYLRLRDLLDLQLPQSKPAAHDETLFIVVHQAFELWFREMIFELETIRELMSSGDPERARHLLRRVHTIERLLIEQIEVLETMSPQDFLEFRTNLNPASGFQSLQFREIEFLCGLKDASFLPLAADDEDRARLQRRFDEPTLWDGFRALLDANDLPMPEADQDAQRTSLVKMARDREAFAEPWYVSEDLLEMDELFSLWRQRHILMVERQIGTKPGTGGSSGASYLRTTLEKRFFPQLWELRSNL